MQWLALLGWLRRQEVARVAVLLENAEEAVLVEVSAYITARPRSYSLPVPYCLSPAPQ
jgi:hypothetical protein